MASPSLLDSAALNQFASSISAHMQRYGYQKFDTPIIQPSDIFLTRAGDQIADTLFTFNQNGRQYALRPEFTASATWMYTEQLQAVASTIPAPIARWQFGGWIFADELSHKAAQQYSIGAELYGFPGAVADAEIIHLASSGLTAYGLPRHRIKIGNVRLMRVLLGGFDLDPRLQRFLLNHVADIANPERGKDYVLSLLDQLMIMASVDETTDDGEMHEGQTQRMYALLLNATQRGTTMGGRTQQDIVRRLMQKQRRAADHAQVVAALDFLEQWSAINAAPDAAFALMETFTREDEAAKYLLEKWQDMIEALTLFGTSHAEVVIRPALSRNWDYYSGMVFELHSSNGIHLGGGGRYDELAQLFGAPRPVSAVGFAYYADAVLQAATNPPQQEKRPFYIVITQDNRDHAIRWSQALQQLGIATALLPAETPGAAEIVGNALRYNGQLYQIADIDALREQLVR